MRFASAPAAAVALLLAAGCTASDDEPRADSAPHRTSDAVPGRGAASTRATIKPDPMPVRARDRQHCPAARSVEGAPPEAVEWVGPHVYGAGDLWTLVPVGSHLPPQRDGKGNLVIKMPWWRAVKGEFTLTARPISTDQPTKAEVVMSSPRGYGREGFVPMLLRVPRTGCWLITATLAQTRVVLTVWVGPGSRS